MKGWKRVTDCRLCGQDRCVVRVDNDRMGYCFRYSKTYFVNSFTGEVNIADGDGKGVELSFFEGPGYHSQEDKEGQLEFKFEG